MTHDHDPARWTASPEEAPELLRGAFAAARNEGPNRSQMRALAVKLAAASAGGAVAVGAVKAASAGNTIATFAGWSATKIAGVIALVGSVVTGTVVWQQHGQDANPARPSEPGVATGSAPQLEPQLTAPTPRPMSPTLSPATVPAVEQLGVSERALEGDPSEAQATESAAGHARSNAPAQPNAPGQPAEREHATGNVGFAGRTARREPRAQSSVAASSQKLSRHVPQSDKTAEISGALSPRPGAQATGQAKGATTVEDGSELRLLQSAQAALRARPREAFQLTQQHRRLYPNGEFAQERDALAIQALMRAGETESARNLAEAFIRSYPSSPHAHRFREAMNIR